MPKTAAEAGAILCDVVRETVIREWGDDLIALILTGSVARNEGSFEWSNDAVRLLGDAEFLVVAKSQSKKGLRGSVQQEIESRLCLLGMYARIGVGVVQPRYLRRLSRHIYSYELRHCGRVVSGDSGVLSLIPDFAPTEIEREDAWRLLCNRMIELLPFASRLTEGDHRTPWQFQYALAKLYLDMATSLLVFLGDYKPTYKGRAEELTALAERKQAHEGLPFPIDEFARTVSVATKWKLNPSGKTDFDGRGAVLNALLLWQWEAARLVSGPASKSVQALWHQLAEQQTGAQKLRGWLYVARRQGWIKSWRNWPRWMRLGRRASPRYWVYLVAVELLLRAPLLDGSAASIQEQDLAPLQMSLPAPRQETESARSGWSLLVHDVAWNYSHFLMETRA